MMLKYYKYRLPFAVPFKTSKKIFEDREGIFIECVTDENQFYGEAAPLPGYSKETLDKVQQTITEIKDILQNGLNELDPADWLQDFYKEENIPASLEFALDSIAYKVQAHRADKSLHSYLFPESSKQIPVNAIVSLQSDDYMTKIEEQLSEGYRTVKFKVGLDFELELNRLKKIRSRFPEVTIRLDANQAWPTKTAISNCRQLELLNIEFCEEPLVDPSPQNFETLYDQTELPLAIDESIYKVSYWPNLLPYTSYLVLKPMLLGSFTKIFETKRFADTHDNKAVFTTSLESGIGRTITAILAAAKGAPKTAQGLSTGKLLAKDVQSDISFITNGFYNLDGLPDRSWSISDKLQEVSSKLF